MNKNINISIYRYVSHITIYCTCTCAFNHLLFGGFAQAKNFNKNKTCNSFLLTELWMLFSKLLPRQIEAVAAIQIYPSLSPMGISGYIHINLLHSRWYIWYACIYMYLLTMLWRGKTGNEAPSMCVGTWPNMGCGACFSKKSFILDSLRSHVVHLQTIYI